MGCSPVGLFEKPAAFTAARPAPSLDPIVQLVSVAPSMVDDETYIVE